MHVNPSTRFAALSALALLFTTVACGGSNDTTPSSSHAAASSATSGTSAGGSGSGGSGAGGGTACPEGSHIEDAGCAATLASWSMGSKLKTGRDHHVTWLATTPSGSYLYVGGGTNGASIFDTVERSTIGADGSLGAFAAGTKLPEGLAGAGLAQADRTLVLAGGLVLSAGNAVTTTDTFIGDIGDDGSIAFTPAPPLLTSRYHLTLSVDRGFVYAIGGLTQGISGGMPTQSVADAVERATFDGKTLGTFTALPPLAAPLTHQAAVVRNHVLYLIGGIVTNTTRKDIVSSAIDASGDLGPWEPAGMLPEGRGTSSAFIFLDQLYVLCGAKLAQGGEVDTVLRAPFNADGSIGTFEDLTPVPMARAHTHQTPLFNGIIYSAAGSKGNTFENEVFLGQLQ